MDGHEIRAQAPTTRVHTFESGTLAAERWAELVLKLNRTWLDGGDVMERYDRFCALDNTMRASWLAWAVAQSLQSTTPGSKADCFVDHLGRKLDIPTAAWWRPTARNFFDRSTKAGILSLLDEVGGSDLRSRYAAARKFDLAASAEKLFAGQIIVEAEVKERALAWLPTAMRFHKEEMPALKAAGLDREMADMPDTAIEPADCQGLSEAA